MRQTITNLDMNRLIGREPVVEQTENSECLIIMGSYENNGYEIQQEISRHYPQVKLYTVIGSVREAGKLRSKSTYRI